MQGYDDGMDETEMNMAAAQMEGQYDQYNHHAHGG